MSYSNLNNNLYINIQNFLIKFTNFNTKKEINELINNTKIRRK